MSSPTFNTIVTILENDFHLTDAAVDPDARLADLGLAPVDQVELFSAVEDAFRLRIPGGLFDPQSTDITLQQLCNVFEETHADAIAAAAHAR